MRKKKLYLKVHPKRDRDLNTLLDESLSTLKQVENVEKVEGQIGLGGVVKKK